ncbi:hypothetical protein B5M10_01590 [Pluralibacter gergoviae]|uniref:hypothetical protein n=1 Tax=Pluralibacter gergoviae TaxID=61647 RepID=UPI0005ECE493|nr:hypothetical protein [Pluralibacter gergoviae]KJM66691.1 hypothetical protein SS31_02155 [Pluralibacter gergoviae]OUR04528.1 hypothetical protein B5M10_01590 [Pluralibacter gergoviae]
MKKISTILIRMKTLDVRVNRASEPELETLMQELTFPGVLNPYKFGLPLMLSMVAALFSFSLPQVAIWHEIFRAAGWPEYAVFAGIVPCILIFCILLFASGSLTARGYSLALKSYLLLLYGTAIVAACYLILTVIKTLTGQYDGIVFLITGVLSAGFSAISLASLNSDRFSQAVSGFMHNRAWRKAWVLRRKSSHSAH